MVESISAESQTSRFFSDVWRFDATTSAWEEITTLGERAIARNAHSASVVAGKMYVFGGSNDDGPMSAISALDLSTDDVYLWALRIYMSIIIHLRCLQALLCGKGYNPNLLVPLLPPRKILQLLRTLRQHRYQWRLH
jgi:hypothetical protein